VPDISFFLSFFLSPQLTDFRWNWTSECWPFFYFLR
jgi:hypothetical protein